MSNNNFRALIIDDEQHCIETLKFEIKRNCPQVTDLHSTSDSTNAIGHIEELKPDIVFLDIEMPGKTGFQILKELDQVNFHLIIVTAYDRYAIRAFKYSAIDYLLKPVDGKELVNAINKIEKAHQNNSPNSIVQLLELVASKQEYPERIGLPVKNTIEFINLNEIRRIEAQGNYVTVHLEEQNMMVSYSLKHMEELLPNSTFYRVHKSHIINKNYIKRFVKSEGGFVEMINGNNIHVTKYDKEEFIRLIN